MTPGHPTSDIAPAHGSETPQPPRADFIASVLWIVFGAAVAIASYRMDRLTNQDINPYTVPGLLPGFLGVALMVFGALLLMRSLRAGALLADTERTPRMTATTFRRIATIIGLCVLYGVGLIGHGLPFWAASALYVFAMISFLQYGQRKTEGQVVRGMVVAAVIGLCAGIAITVVFQELFLVRLP